MVFATSANAEWRGLDQPDVLSVRIDQVRAAHVAELNAYVDRLSAGLGRRIPYFDPSDGGSSARILVFLETPGPSTAVVRFTSRDNPTGTAKNLRRLFSAASIDRADTAIWNAVPWVLAPGRKRLRAPNSADVVEAAAQLPLLFPLFPNLHTVILAGKTAAQLQPVVIRIAPEVAIHLIPHPSPVYVNTRPNIFPDMLATFKTVAASLRRRRG